MEDQMQRCWEFMRCGNEHLCTAYPDGGEECWGFAGTKRRLGPPIKSEEDKKKEKKSTEDVENLSVVRRRCKFILRYGMCQCCPFYQYAEKIRGKRKPLSGMEF